MLEHLFVDNFAIQQFNLKPNGNFVILHMMNVKLSTKKMPMVSKSFILTKAAAGRLAEVIKTNLERTE